MSDILPPRGRDTVHPIACESSCLRRAMGPLVVGSWIRAAGWRAEASLFISSAVLSGTVCVLLKSPLASPFCFRTRFCPCLASRSASMESLLRFCGRVSRRFESGVAVIVVGEDKVSLLRGGIVSRRFSRIMPSYECPGEARCRGVDARKVSGTFWWSTTGPHPKNFQDPIRYRVILALLPTRHLHGFFEL